MYVATGAFDVLFGDVGSLKVKRGLVRPLVADLRRTFAVSCGEVGDADPLRRAVIGVAAVANEAGAALAVVEQCERFVARRPECDLLSAAVRVFRPEIDFPG
jgi:uncharacterized protein YlxP (DUF503 family)